MGEGLGVPQLHVASLAYERKSETINGDLQGLPTAPPIPLVLLPKWVISIRRISVETF